MKKKIALVGNIQNWNFALMCWLRDLGYTANLFYQPVSHFKAEADTFSLDALHYCKEVNWIKKGFPPTENVIEAIKEELKTYDFIIASGTEAAFLSFCDIKIDIYIPLGSDFLWEPFYPHEYPLLTKLYYRLHPKKKFNLLKFGTISKYLHRAIKNASHIILESTNREYESNLYKLNFKGKHHRFSVPFIYFPDAVDHFKRENKPAVHWRDIIESIRNENKFIILYHGRQVWKTENDINKHTDYLIKGFAAFIKESNIGNKSKLIMLEYGEDVNPSKELINELGISKHVIWLPTMQRKDLMYLISNVDLCTGEFGESFLTFGTIVEAMVMGKPVLSFRDDSLYEDQYETLYPLFNAQYPEEIKEHLLGVCENKDKLENTGEIAKDWVIKNFFEMPLKQICKIIEETK